MSLYSHTRNLEEEAAALLKGLPLFESLDSNDRAPIARRLLRREFASGVTLYHQDMPGMMLYIIETGKVRLFSVGRTGQELTFAIYGAGELFGELSLLDGKHHSSSAITLSSTVVWMLGRNDLEDLLETKPEVARGMLKILVRRIRERGMHLESLTFQDVLGRLAYELIKLSEKHGRRTEEGVFIEAPLTQVELATVVGATRESVNKALATLRARELISVDGSNMVVTNINGLKKILVERGR
jgi:CRP-like cAMP-binding protein